MKCDLVKKFAICKEKKNKRQNNDAMLEMMTS
jgi:hypothetical protein